MTVARKHLVDAQTTPLYHVTNRCVRRAFLCGNDPYTGKNFDHRRQFMIELVRKYLSVFAIYQCGFSIMSNHFHLILWLNPTEAKAWSTKEVLSRWTKIFRGHPLAQRYLEKDELSPEELRALNDITETYRQRLSDLSWFMAKLDETVARQANKEDQCSGRFWEGRFKSQALLDETALITCMMYVDLNPIRAGMAKTLEGSDYTSIQQRIMEIRRTSTKPARQKSAKKKKVKNKPADSPTQTGVSLLPFLACEKLGNEKLSENPGKPAGIPIRFQDYLTLIDWTGREIREDKRGAIPKDVAPILDRLCIKNDKWLETVTQIEKVFRYAVGASHSFERFRDKLSKKWLYGKRFAQEAYTEPASAVT